MLKVAIIERFYRSICMCKIIESMLTQCIREREKGKIEIRPEKAWDTIGLKLGKHVKSIARH